MITNIVSSPGKKFEPRRVLASNSSHPDLSKMKIKSLPILSKFVSPAKFSKEFNYDQPFYLSLSVSYHAKWNYHNEESWKALSDEELEAKPLQDSVENDLEKLTL